MRLPAQPFFMAVATAVLMLMPGCSLLRHEYEFVAKYSTEFIRLASDSTVSASERRLYYDTHLAAYISVFDSASHESLDSLLNAENLNTSALRTVFRGAVYTGALKALANLPECRERYLHTESYRQLKYLYRVLAPFVQEMSAWSGRSNLPDECAFQLGRLKIFPYSFSSIKAAAAFRDGLARTFLLGLYRQLDETDGTRGRQRPEAWDLCRLHYRYLRPQIEKESYRLQLDKMLNNQEPDIRNIRTTLARALPRAVEKVDIQFKMGT